MGELMELRQSRSELSLRRFACYAGIPYWRLRDFEKRAEQRKARTQVQDELREAARRVALEHPTYGYRFLYQELWSWSV